MTDETMRDGSVVFSNLPVMLYISTERMVRKELGMLINRLSATGFGYNWKD